MSGRRSILARCMLAGVWCYQAALSPLMGGHCRFQPTCSRYAAQAIRAHGALRGGWLGLRRVCRCHPFGGKGFDPVPERPAGPTNRAPNGEPDLS